MLLIQPEIQLVQSTAHQDELLQLSLDYFHWLDREYLRNYSKSLTQVVGMPLADYVRQSQAHFFQQSAEDGAFYLLRSNHTCIGMAGLRRLDWQTAEIKRLYLMESARGQGYASYLVDFLIQQARRLRYTTLLLDSAPFMHSAHRLYDRKGFQLCAAYRASEVPPELHSHWLFMRLNLKLVEA